MEISRRGFLTLGGIFGAGSVLPGCARQAVLKPKEEGPPPLGKEDFTQSVCRLCPAGCGLQVRRVDGKAVGVSGLPEHPVNHGALCPKGAALLQELYHPDRLRTPVERSGPRGDGTWRPISWEEAFRRIAGRLGGAKAGGSRLDAVSSSRGWDVEGELLERLSLASGGASYSFDLAQNQRPLDAFAAMHGTRQVYCDPSRARLLVSFGADWLQTQPEHIQAQQLWARLRSRAGGARVHVVQVESRFSVTAGKADSWAPVRPGTEGFVALGVAREMISTGRYDTAFIRQRSRGFEAFSKAIEPFTVERVSEATGLSERGLRLLYAKFQGTRPAVAMGGRGAPWAQMAVHALNALTGSLGEDAMFSAGSEDDAPIRPPMDLDGAGSEVVLLDRVNPVFLAPRPWKAALDRAALVVAVSPYRTETAEYADLVLPCHTPLEQLHASRHRLQDGRLVTNLASRGVDPLYDTKDPGEIFLLIGREAFGGRMPSGDFAKHLEARAKEKGARGLEEGTVAWAESAAPARGSLYANPSGRFEFEALTRAIPSGDLEPSAGRDFPLWLYPYSPLPFSFGEGAHLPYLQAIAGVQTGEMWETWAELHPDTAAACGVREGQSVRISSALGSLQARVRIIASAMPGIVSMPVGLGHTAYGRWASGVGANPMELAGGAGGGRVRVEGA